MPVSSVFEDIEDGLSMAEVMEQFEVTREEIKSVLEFAARSLEPPPVPVGAPDLIDAHSL